jgi:hypothetical protein
VANRCCPPQASPGVLDSRAMSPGQFFRVGMRPPRPNGGEIIGAGSPFVVSGQWWMPFFPGAVLILPTAGFILVGDGLSARTERQGALDDNPVSRVGSMFGPKITSSIACTYQTSQLKQARLQAGREKACKIRVQFLSSTRLALFRTPIVSQGKPASAPSLRSAKGLPHSQVATVVEEIRIDVGPAIPAGSISAAYNNLLHGR